jgi:thioredoxin reductase (NADPH)
MSIFDVAVIGGGSAGTMAMQRTILNNDSCLFFTGTAKHKKKSRAFWVSKVENMPAHFQYKKAIEEPNKDVVDWINQSPFKSKLTLKKNIGVVSIKKGLDGNFVIVDSNEEIHQAKFVILCTGVMDIQPVIEGSINPILPFANVQLADYCLRCDGHHVLNKRLAVIGHSLSTIWVAVMLYERYQCPEVSILTNGEDLVFDEETKKLFDKYKFKLHKEKIIQIIGDPKQNILNGLKLSTNHLVEADYVFISLGMIVYNDLAKELGANLDDRGFVLTDAKGKSSVDGFFVAGDLRANTKKQIYTAWDTAVDAADEINTLLRREKRNRQL